MKKGNKHIEVEAETHKRAKEQANKAGMTLKAYISACLVQCKSDARFK